MKALFLICLVMLISCKKGHQGERNESLTGNQLNATIFLSSGDSTNIKIVGEDVHIGACGAAYSIGGYVYGVSKSWASISLSTLVGCPNSAGQFELSCQYIPDIRITNGPFYESDNILRPGRITYTMVIGNYYEGYFNDICRDYFNNDSVIIKGTFKGHSE